MTIPTMSFVAGFIGSPRMNLMRATVVSSSGQRAVVRPDAFPDTTVEVRLRGAAVAAGAAVTLGIRPEHFIDAADGVPSLNATAQVVEQLGGVSYVYASGTDGVQITVQEKGHSRVPAGATIRIGLDAQLCLLFGADGKRL